MENLISTFFILFSIIRRFYFSLSNFCCRSYKSGFVWHDICEDDLILPAHGHEYVLKGSELFDDCNSGETRSLCYQRDLDNYTLKLGRKFLKNFLDAFE